MLESGFVPHNGRGKTIGIFGRDIEALQHIHQGNHVVVLLLILFANEFCSVLMDVDVRIDIFVEVGLIVVIEGAKQCFGFIIFSSGGWWFRNENGVIGFICPSGRWLRWVGFWLNTVARANLIFADPALIRASSPRRLHPSVCLWN